MAFNTPFKMWKRYEFNGGTSDPCIISWPAGMTAGGELRDQYHHAIDLVPTILDVAGVQPPEVIGGHVQSRFDGVSMRYSFDDGRRRARARRSSIRCSGHGRSGTTGGRPSPPIPRSAAGATSTTTRGSCTTPRSTAPSCTTSAEHPERLREMINLWYAEAGANGAFPLDDRGRARDLTTPRPQLTPPATATSTTPTPRRSPSPRRSTSATAPTRIGALVDIPAAGGAGRAVRPRLAVRRSFAVREGQPPALRLQLGRQLSSRRSSATRTSPWARSSSWPPALRRTARRRRESRPGSCPLPRREEGRRGPDQDPAREVHARRRGPVRGTRQQRGGDRRLPGCESPHTFTGGTINRVAVDVSGEPYIDLEREAAGHARARVADGSNAHGRACSDRAGAAREPGSGAWRSCSPRARHASWSARSPATPASSAIPRTRSRSSSGRSCSRPPARCSRSRHFPIAIGQGAGGRDGRRPSSSRLAPCSST